MIVQSIDPAAPLNKSARPAGTRGKPAGPSGTIHRAHRREGRGPGVELSAARRHERRQAPQLTIAFGARRQHAGERQIHHSSGPPSFTAPPPNLLADKARLGLGPARFLA